MIKTAFTELLNFEILKWSAKAVWLEWKFAELLHALFTPYATMDMHPSDLIKFEDILWKLMWSMMNGSDHQHVSPIVEFYIFGTQVENFSEFLTWSSYLILTMDP